MVCGRCRREIWVVGGAVLSFDALCEGGGMGAGGSWVFILLDEGRVLGVWLGGEGDRRRGERQLLAADGLLVGGGRSQWLAEGTGFRVSSPR